MKIVILDGYTQNPGDLDWNGFSKLGEVVCYDRTEPSRVIERIGDAEIAVINKVSLTREVFAACPKLRYVGVLATGYNVVDLDAAREAGVTVTNVPSYGTDAVAQYVFALLLEICHHVSTHSDAVKAGEWTNCPDFCFWKYPLIELAGKTMGIIGFGRIGQRTAEIAQSLGMKVLADARHEKPELVSETCRFASLEEIYEKADVISLHCPLFPETRGMIDRTAIARMKDGVILINTARGPLIVEQDLCDALNSGKVAAAACDVVSEEPVRPDNPLLQAKNILITPHIAWAPREARLRLMDIAVSNLEAFLRGEPVNTVGEPSGGKR